MPRIKKKIQKLPTKLKISRIGYKWKPKIPEWKKIQNIKNRQKMKRKNWVCRDISVPNTTTWYARCTYRRFSHVTCSGTIRWWLFFPNGNGESSQEYECGCEEDDIIMMENNEMRCTHPSPERVVALSGSELWRTDGCISRTSGLSPPSFPQYRFLLPFQQYCWKRVDAFQEHESRELWRRSHWSV